RRLRAALAVLAAAATGLTLGATAVPVAASPAAATAARPQVRINQVGYAPRAPKVAFAMVARRAGSIGFTVLGSHGVVFRGRSSAFAGSWNAGYRAVYRLDFSGLTRPGQYRIRIQAGGATATSPSFRIAPSAALYHQLVLNAVRYFTSERDGADVVRSVLDRRPANLTDRRAFVY